MESTSRENPQNIPKFLRKIIQDKKDIKQAIKDKKSLSELAKEKDIHFAKLL